MVDSVEKARRRSQNLRDLFGAQYDETVRCPWCDSGDTRVTSPYGGTVSEMGMQCNACEATFGWMKWQGKLPGQRETH